MKLNFMHILAKLGFDGVYPIYWVKESKAWHRIYKYEICMHNTSNHQKEDITWTKTPSKPRSTQKCNTNKRLSKLYLRIELTQSWFQSSTSEQGKTNEQNELNKTHTLKDVSHFKEFETNNKIWDNQLPTRARFQQINPTLHTFYDGTTYQKEKVCLPKTNTWYRSR